jgi:hypothetical protein
MSEYFQKVPRGCTDACSIFAYILCLHGAGARHAAVSSGGGGGGGGT